MTKEQNKQIPLPTNKDAKWGDVKFLVGRYGSEIGFFLRTKLYSV